MAPPVFTFEGVYTPIITPFHKSGEIDFDTLGEVIEFLIEQGVHGIITGGSTGENYAQTVAERLDIAKFAAHIIKQRTPLVVGTGAMLTPDSLALAKGARDLGANAILLASPPYALPTGRENALNALAIDQAANLPIMLYNYPGRTGTMMGEEFLDQIGCSSNFCGIKESSGDINQLHRLACNYPYIQLGCGMDDQILEFFAWGARFWVCGGSNFLPAEHIALYEACVLEGDFNKGRRIMSAMMPLMNLLEQGGKFVQNIKYGVSLLGMNASVVRAPLQDLTKQEQISLEKITQDIQLTIRQITNTG